MIGHALAHYHSLAEVSPIGLATLFVVAVAVPSIVLAKALLKALHWSALLRWSSFGVNYFTFGGPVNEEPGWRGLALPKLRARFGAFTGRIVVEMLRPALYGRSG